MVPLEMPVTLDYQEDQVERGTQELTDCLDVIRRACPVTLEMQAQLEAEVFPE